MCENIGEQEATVTQELVPNAIKVGTTSTTTTTTTTNIITTAATCSGNTGQSGSAVLSLFDQLKNSVSHNLATNNNNYKTFISQQSVHNQTCTDINQTDVNKSNEQNFKLQHSANDNNKWQSFHTTAVKSLTTAVDLLQQEEQGSENDKDQQEADECVRNEYDENEDENVDTDADADIDEDDDNNSDSDNDDDDDDDDDGKEQFIENTKRIYNKIIENKITNREQFKKTCIKPIIIDCKLKLTPTPTTTTATSSERFSNMAEECNDLTSCSSASSISATTAPLQIALDSTSSHSNSSSSNGSILSNGIFNKEHEHASYNIEKLSSTANLKTKFDFLTKSSNELNTNTTTATTTLALSATSSFKAAINETTLKPLSITNFFATDGNANSTTTTTTTTTIATTTTTAATTTTTTTTTNTTTTTTSTTLSENNNQKRDAIVTKREQFSIPSSLLLPVVSPLLGIVHGTKRASILSLSSSTATTTTPTPTPIQPPPPPPPTQNDTSSLSPALEMQSPTHLDANNRSRKLVQNPSNEIAFSSQQQLHPPQLKEQLQLMPNAYPHPYGQRQLHKAGSANTKKIQKTVLSFSRNAGNESKRKCCNDRYDSSESSDR